MKDRGGANPVVVLAVIALMAALLLFVLWRWADGRVAASRPEPLPTAPIVTGTPAPVLGTGVMSWRRLPGAIARDVNLAAFATALQPLAAGLNDRSCVAVSVDGQPAAASADVVAIPASAQKLLVAAAALDVLGAEFRYTTEVRAPAPVGGVITGDVYFVGGGDPLLTAGDYPVVNDLYPVINPTSLDALVDSVVAAGVTRIEGNIVGDGTRYDDEFFAPGWADGVAVTEAGPYDALLVSDARQLGDPLKASDPAEGAARELLRLLEAKGVGVSGQAAVGGAPAGLEVVASIQSVPLTDVVAEMLTNSDNNTAELMVKEVGLVAGSAGTRVAGLTAIQGRLTTWGLATPGLVLADGSGLSPDNRISCAAMLGLLQRGGIDDPIGAGLAVAGQTGTLADVFTESSVTGRLRGKTGTLNNPPFNEDPPAVKTLAGYVAVEGGGAIEFVLLLNGPTISDQSEYRPVWDQLASILGDYPAGVSAAELAPR